jgi:dephospho-CoA kinase
MASGRYTVSSAARIIGITGGIGCGKSEVGRMVQAEGWMVRDADDMVHELLGPGQPLLAQVVQRFGPAYVQEDGTLNRAGLAAHVFGCPHALKDLNRMVHPVVLERVRQWVRLRRENGDNAAVIIPLLHETGITGLWDAVICVCASAETAGGRLHARGWTDQDIEQRRRSQWPLAEKMKSSDYVIYNDGTLADLAQETRKVLNRILEKE